jgi:hypothetical protein
MNFKRWSALLLALLFLCGCAARRNRAYVSSTLPKMPEQRAPEYLAPPPPPTPESVAPHEVKPAAPTEERELRVWKPDPPRPVINKKPARSKAKRTRANPVTELPKKHPGAGKLDAQWKPDPIHVGLGVLLLVAGIAWISRKST